MARPVSFVLLCCLCLLAAMPPALAQTESAKVMPAPAPAAQSVAPYLPLSTLPPIPLDEAHDGFGIAQQLARSKKLQARILWIDATANMDSYNTSAKITDLVAHIHKAGFNTVVLDIKPIAGYTLYPSQYAPKLTEWKGQTLPTNFDPLPDFIARCHAVGLQFVVSMNAFSEGHTVMKVGPGYTHPEWQTTLYVAKPLVRNALPGSPAFPINDQPNQPARNEQELALMNDLTNYVPDGGSTLALIDPMGTVLALVDGADLSTLDAGMVAKSNALVGNGAAADFLHQHAHVGDRLILDSTRDFVPIGQYADAHVPLMVNPNDPEVRQRLQAMVEEVVRNYAVDGVLFDDRFRYAGLQADFSESTRRQFEQFMGRSLAWPDDVLQYSYSFPTLTRRLVPGPCYDAWLAWRAMTLRNFLAGVVQSVKTIRPGATVSVYAGSWYGQYADLGANWAADDFQAGFRFLTPAFQKTGFAGLLDWITVGCYYPTGTMAEAVAAGKSPGATVEAAGQLANRVVNDETWIYAGINLADYMKRPELVKNAIQAALASTQGVMIFDLSYNIDLWWPIFEEAFREPAVAPHASPDLLAQLRQAHAAHKASGILDPPVTILSGDSGTGL